jgi:phosphatidylglycerophosphate synthase
MAIDLKALPPSSCDLTAGPAVVGAPAALRRDALHAGLAALLALGVTAWVVALRAALGPGFAMQALAVFALGLVCMLRGLDSHAPRARFGAGNRVTLLRLALVALLAGAIGRHPGVPVEALAWGAVVVATVAALLDALDGPLARAQGLASPFGARFDMECDALLVLVLSLLVFGLGKAGVWIVAAGLMRYAFVAAGKAWPWIDRPLPPSLRRKTVCVLQITALIVCLGPVVAPAWSRWIAGLSLAALGASFAADLRWLAARRAIAKEAGSAH